MKRAAAGDMLELEIFNKFITIEARNVSKY